MKRPDYNRGLADNMFHERIEDAFESQSNSLIVVLSSDVPTTITSIVERAQERQQLFSLRSCRLMIKKT